ncbi:MAG: M23 family metallopeptidase [Bacteroidales bacterium]|jgi:murein DD-endopeptidase MepM/ murein hydrolase activator NlpD|nr:M23 family metallopeptidase [Bacteroidales bacterium]MCI1785395.1 M23 family metallopeptidase [Bacteroidales bacterium]
MSRQNKDQKVDNFRLALIEDRTHKQIWALRFTRASFLVTVISIIVVICLGLFSIIAFTPIRTFIPGYPDAHTKHAAIRNAIMIDSLQNIIGKWELYSENLSRIVDGKEPIRLDSLIKSDNEASVSSKNAGKLAMKDSLLRSNVKEAEQFDISDDKTRNLQIEGMHFFVPLKGVISQGYDKVIHPYIDITAPANSVVMATLDGTVIFSGWDDETGYTIQLQHANNIVSIYKHNQILLKKTGDKVSAGTPIALVGNSGSLTTGDHLHFELWYKGEAVDPTQYINF